MRRVRGEQLHRLLLDVGEEVGAAQVTLERARKRGVRLPLLDLRAHPRGVFGLFRRLGEPRRRHGEKVAVGVTLRFDGVHLLSQRRHRGLTYRLTIGERASGPAINERRARRGVRRLCRQQRRAASLDITFGASDRRLRHLEAGLRRSEIGRGAAARCGQHNELVGGGIRGHEGGPHRLSVRLRFAMLAVEPLARGHQRRASLLDPLFARQDELPQAVERANALRYRQPRRFQLPVRRRVGVQRGIERPDGVTVFLVCAVCEADARRHPREHQSERTFGGLRGLEGVRNLAGFAQTQRCVSFGGGHRRLEPVGRDAGEPDLLHEFVHLALRFDDGSRGRERVGLGRRSRLVALLRGAFGATELTYAVRQSVFRGREVGRGLDAGQLRDRLAADRTGVARLEHAAEVRRLLAASHALQVRALTADQRTRRLARLVRGDRHRIRGLRRVDCALGACER